MNEKDEAVNKKNDSHISKKKDVQLPKKKNNSPILQKQNDTSTSSVSYKINDTLMSYNKNDDNISKIKYMADHEFFKCSFCEVKIDVYKVFKITFTLSCVIVLLWMLMKLSVTQNTIFWLLTWFSKMLLNNFFFLL